MYDFGEKICEIKTDFNNEDIISELKKYFPEITVNTWDVKLYYLPHYV